MGRHFSHLQSAVRVIEKYDGSLPFNTFIKGFFAKEKRYGSKDRKQIATLCYNYFRSGHLLKHEGIEDKILTAVFLSQQNHSDFLAELRPAWNEQISLSFSEKLAFLHKRIDDIFPFLQALSPDIDPEKFVESHFIQPSLFIRVRPGKSKIVEEKLSTAAVPFEWIDVDCISLPNSTRVEEILAINKEVVIQDRNSQRVLDFFKSSKPYSNESTAWDCCAASGGKSILLHDRLQGKVRLTVTDIRETILSKLHTRLHNAGIKIEKSFLLDLAKSGLPADDNFDIILCDVPCSGSGTWGRTPEQMYYFQKNKIRSYADLQQQIITHSIASLQKNSIFFYITCSVFFEENERQVTFIKENFPVKHLQAEYFKGYEERADTMFVAVFKSLADPKSDKKSKA